MTQSDTTTVIVATAPKSIAGALVLTFLFGPLGLLYASLWGGILMIVLALVTVPFTAGLAALVLWPVSIIWAIIAAVSSKSKAGTVA